MAGFNFIIPLSDHPTLTGVKRRYTQTGEDRNDKLKRIEVKGEVFYYQIVNGIEIPAMLEFIENGIKNWSLFAENSNMVDANGNRVAIIPESTDAQGVVTPAHYPNGSIGEYDFWMNAYYNMVKVQQLPVAIFDMYQQQILIVDSKGGFNII